MKALVGCLSLAATFVLCSHSTWGQEEDGEGATGPVLPCVQEGQEALRASLVLLDTSTDSLVLRTASSGQLALIFQPSCLLASSTAEPLVELLPNPAVDEDFPAGVEDDAEIDMSSDDMVITLPITRSDFEVGKYDALVRVKGDEFVTTNVSVNASVKEDNPLVPGSAAVLGLMGGLIAAAFAAWNLNPPEGEEDNPFNGTMRALLKPWAAIALAVGVVLVFIAETSPFQQLYSDVDFWESNLLYWSGMLGASFALGTSTSVATLVARGMSKPLRMTPVGASEESTD